MTAAGVALAAVLAGESGQQPSFPSSVEAVYLDVVVDHDGQPVGGLTPSDFEVRDDGVRQAVRLARHQDVPLTAVLVFDSSRSVAGERIHHLRAAGSALLEGLREQDEAALVAFSEELSVVAPRRAGRSAVAQALGSMRPGGATAMWDALYAGLKLTRARGRALVVLFTDAEDNMSWLSARQVRRVAEESSAVVHVVTLALPAGHVEPTHRRALRELAEATGGRLWAADGDRGLEPTFRRILSEMESSYLLTYEPAAGAREGWHRIDVKVKKGRGRVRTRRGYLVPPRPGR